MQVPEGHIGSDWARAYLTYMSDSREVEIDHSAAPMLLYATSCYDALNEVLYSKNAM